MDTLVAFVLILIGIVLVVVNYFKNDKGCNNVPVVVYKPVYEDIYEAQWSSSNFPSHVYNKLFNESTPWVGGFKIGDGKTVIKK